MSDLVEFLKARLDEDEQKANACISRLNPPWGDWHFENMQVRDARDHLVVQHTWPHEGEHIARHDPARVLREVEAKRRIIELHQEGVSNDLPVDEEPTAEGVFCMVCTPVGEPPFYPCSTLRLLALPYAEHPEYQEAWRV